MVMVVVRELLSLVTSVICVWIRGYEDCLPHGSDFCLLLCIYHSGLVGTISTLFCYINSKLVLFFVVDFIAVLALRCNPIDFIQNQSGGP